MESGDAQIQEWSACGLNLYWYVFLFCVDGVEQDSKLCRKRNVATTLYILLVPVINSNW